MTDISVRTVAGATDTTSTDLADVLDDVYQGTGGWFAAQQVAGKQASGQPTARDLSTLTAQAAKMVFTDAALFTRDQALMTLYVEDSDGGYPLLAYWSPYQAVVGGNLTATGPKTMMIASAVDTQTSCTFTTNHIAKSGGDAWEEADEGKVISVETSGNQYTISNFVDADNVDVTPDPDSETDTKDCYTLTVDATGTLIQYGLVAVDTFDPKMTGATVTFTDGGAYTLLKVTSGTVAILDGDATSETANNTFVITWADQVYAWRGHASDQPAARVGAKLTASTACLARWMGHGTVQFNTAPQREYDILGRIDGDECILDDASSTAPTEANNDAIAFTMPPSIWNRVDVLLPAGNVDAISSQISYANYSYINLRGAGPGRSFITGEVTADTLIDASAADHYKWSGFTIENLDDTSVGNNSGAVEGYARSTFILPVDVVWEDLVVRANGTGTANVTASAVRGFSGRMRNVQMFGTRSLSGCNKVVVFELVNCRGQGYRGIEMVGGGQVVNCVAVGLDRAAFHFCTGQSLIPHDTVLVNCVGTNLSTIAPGAAAYGELGWLQAPGTETLLLNCVGIVTSTDGYAVSSLAALAGCTPVRISGGAYISAGESDHTISAGTSQTLYIAGSPIVRNRTDGTLLIDDSFTDVIGDGISVMGSDDPVIDGQMQYDPDTDRFMGQRNGVDMVFGAGAGPFVGPFR